MDIIDENWNELLFDYIHEMLEGRDKLSYELTISALTSKLHDGHVSFTRRIGYFRILNTKFGGFVAPIRLTEAEGYVVVNEVAAKYKQSCPLLPGDIVLRVNGTDVDEIVTDMLRYVSYPNDEKALAFLLRRYTVLSQMSSKNLMEIDVLRDNIELKLYSEVMLFDYKFTSPKKPLSSYELLDNNIGLINPAMLERDGNNIKKIMETFAKTDGIIVDLRQYPGRYIVYELAEYLVEEKKLFNIVSFPSQSNPGMFVDLNSNYSGGVQNPDSYYYEKKVVLLMDETTQSQPEFTVMSLRNGANVTVMGSNSSGANGDVTSLPLPGGLTMMYTGLGVYTPEGGQTQRIGLSPDICVERTVAGVRNGRDELMEEAIQYLINSNEKKTP